MPPTLTFSHPATDDDEFYGLPVAVQDEVDVLLRVMCRIHNAPPKMRVRQMQEESDRIGGGRGNSWRSLRTTSWARWRCAGSTGAARCSALP